MALWGDAKIFFCVLFFACCCTLTLAQVPMDCCLEVREPLIGKGRVVDYHVQIAGGGCAIDATILVTRQNRKLCVPAKGPRVTSLKNHVDNLRKECEKANYKGQRCVGVQRK